MPHDNYRSDIEYRGFSMCPGVLPARILADLTEWLESPGATGSVYGLRNLLRRSPVVRAVANMWDVKELVTTILGPGARAVRAILFDKQLGANWGVGWHQDLTIAVKERAEVDGFTAWTVKEGVPHVQPPVDILQRMLTLRLHLDAADAESGALVVMPGTHAFGRLPETWSAPGNNVAPVICAAAAGDILAFRPLLLHMSRKSARLAPAGHPDRVRRRVIAATASVA